MLNDRNASINLLTESWVPIKNSDRFCTVEDVIFGRCDYDFKISLLNLFFDCFVINCLHASLGNFMKENENVDVFRESITENNIFNIKEFGNQSIFSSILEAFNTKNFMQCKLKNNHNEIDIHKAIDFKTLLLNVPGQANIQNGKITHENSWSNKNFSEGEKALILFGNSLFGTSSGGLPIGTYTAANGFTTCFFKHKTDHKQNWVINLNWKILESSICEPENFWWHLEKSEELVSFNDKHTQDTFTNIQKRTQLLFPLKSLVYSEGEQYYIFSSKSAKEWLSDNRDDLINSQIRLKNNDHIRNMPYLIFNNEYTDKTKKTIEKKIIANPSCIMSGNKQIQWKADFDNDYVSCLNYNNIIRLPEENRTDFSKLIRGGIYSKVIFKEYIECYLNDYGFTEDLIEDLIDNHDDNENIGKYIKDIINIKDRKQYACDLIEKIKSCITAKHEKIFDILIKQKLIKENDKKSTIDAIKKDYEEWYNSDKGIGKYNVTISTIYNNFISSKTKENTIDKQKEYNLFSNKIYSWKDAVFKEVLDRNIKTKFLIFSILYLDKKDVPMKQNNKEIKISELLKKVYPIIVKMLNTNDFNEIRKLEKCLSINSYQLSQSKYFIHCIDDINENSETEIETNMFSQMIKMLLILSVNFRKKYSNKAHDMPDHESANLFIKFGKLIGNDDVMTKKLIPFLDRLQKSNIQSEKIDIILDFFIKNRMLLIEKRNISFHSILYIASFLLLSTRKACDNIALGFFKQ